MLLRLFQSAKMRAFRWGRSGAAAESHPYGPEAWTELGAILWQHRERLALGFCLMLANRVASMVLPASPKWMLDEVVAKERWDLLTPLALVTCVAMVVQAITSFSLSQVIGVAAQRAIATFRRVTEAHVLRLPIAYFDSTKSGILVSRVMNDTESIRHVVGNDLISFVGSLMTAVMALSVLCYLNLRLTGLLILVLVAQSAVMLVAFRYLRPLYREHGQIKADVTGRLVEVFSCARVVKAYTAEKREELIFTKGVHRLFRNVARSMTAGSLMTSLSGAALSTIGTGTILISGSAIYEGTMTVGDFVTYIIFTGLTVSPILHLASLNSAFSEALAGLDRIRELRRVEAEHQDDRQCVPVPHVKGDVRLENVTFEYTPGVPVLRRVSLHAPAGSTTALVGPSGSGKSTLISLVLALHRPTFGLVLIDGRDLTTLRLDEYRSHVAVVLQENCIFAGTIAENIAYGRPRATREEMEAAGRFAHCDEFVRTFEHGYDTTIGERGVRLSGGERQRVAIARALLADPKILILDEATSSLDSECEALIQNSLRRLRQGRTTFVIAHRLSTIRSADQIVVLHDGDIVERGTHEQLLARPGRYRQLYQTQHRIATDQFINPGEVLAPVGERTG